MILYKLARNTREVMDARAVLKFLKLENISEHLSGYVEDRIELLKLELQEDAASTGAKILILVVMLIFGLFCLLFVSMALAILLNNVLDHNFVGYLIVGGVHLIVMVTAFVLKNSSRLRDILYKTISRSFDKGK